jgi:glutamine synthetase adenylyltransferase
MVRENPLGTATEVGPRSTKVTAATLGAAASSLFWAIAAMTFAKTWDPTQLATVTTLSTAFVSALAGYFAQESPEYTGWNQRWQDKKRDRASARAEAQQAHQRADDAEERLRSAQAEAATHAASLRDRTKVEQVQAQLLDQVEKLNQAVTTLGSRVDQVKAPRKALPPRTSTENATSTP